MRIARNLAFVALLVSSAATAQAPRGADTLSPGAVTELLARLKRLTNSVVGNPNKDAAWHERGMVAWTLSARGKAPSPPAGLDPTRLGRVADSSLRMAARVNPDDIRYQIAAGRFLMNSGNPTARTAARGYFERALRTAEKRGTPALQAEAALALGGTFWWRYDVLANRRLVISTLVMPRSVSEAMSPTSQEAAELIAKINAAEEAAAQIDAESGQFGKTRPEDLSPTQIAKYSMGIGPDMVLDSRQRLSFKGVRDLLETNSQSLVGAARMGDAEFERAYELYHQAYRTDPTFPGAFRAIAMVYTDRGLWGNLETLARSHVLAFPRDSVAWLALGLAMHRQQKDLAARVAFDTALQTLGPAERDRLDDWTRVLPPGTLPAGSEAELLAKERLYWLLSNPIWADSGLQTKVEFLARVAYAELRWTVEEFGLQGADTDRGVTYVRYGPPDDIAGIGSAAAESSDITTYWMYNKTGFLFAFNAMPTFATARVAQNDWTMVQALRRAAPVRWDNVTPPATDTVPVRITRFRGTRDSADVIVAARLPSPDTIHKSMSVKGDVRRFFWLMTPELVQKRGSAETMDTAGVYSWTTRLRAAGYVYRVEEFGSTARYAARAVGAIDATIRDFPSHGFGVSDMLLADRLAEPEPGPTRWNELRLAPSVGSVRRGSTVSLVWENYELTPRDGQAQYTVSVTLKKERSAGGRIVAQVVGAVEAALRVDRNNDQMVIAYDRAIPHAIAFADHLNLSLGETPTGTYAVTLELTDRASGAKASRTTTLVIRD